MDYKFSVIDEYGDETEYSVPGKYVVCQRCDGKGVHDNPAFDNGLTHEDFEEDPDFREQYMSGYYDVQCGDCKGQRVVLVVDDAKCLETCNSDEIRALGMHYNQENERKAEAAHDRWLRSHGIEY